MKNSKRFYVLLSSLLAAVLAVILCCCFLFGDGVSVASAAVSASERVWSAEGYTDPVNDLSYDSDFDIDDYPVDSTDYNLYVIQIAESDEHELYLYVYQPYGNSRYDLTARRVSISETTADKAYYSNYSLTLVGYNGVFYKYVVDNLVTPDDNDHFYSIASISRDYYASIDGSNTLDNTSGLYACTVGQCWEVFIYTDGTKGYFVEEERVVEITPYVSWFRITTRDQEKTFRMHYDWQQYFFVAFDSYVDIDFLFEADVSFTSISYQLEGYYQGGIQEISKINPVVNNDYLETPKTLNYQTDETKSSKTGRRKCVTYSFSQICEAPLFFDYIQSVLDANEKADVSEYEVNDDIADLLQTYQYCLTFHSFTGNCYNSFGSTSITGTFDEVQNVSIMRLNYMYNDEVFNVGVVSNTVNPNKNNKTGSAAEATVEKTESSCSQNSKRFLTVFLVVLLVIVIVVIIVWAVRRSRHGGGNSGSNITINIPGLDGSVGSSAPPDVPQDDDIGGNPVVPDPPSSSGSPGGSSARGGSYGKNTSTGSNNSGSHKS